MSFTEADGTRLALVGATRRGTRMFTAQQLLDLPGNTLVLRMDTWHAAPSVFPNVLTALVTAMSIALVSVLVVLVRDNRRRLSAERDLGDALAFRKAMEDSLVTGLRARDLQGRITYVNPAFCAMVGFSAAELMGQDTPPYWPPEHAREYAERQMVRMAGRLDPPREGYESTFMRKDGTRFPVLIIEAPLINAQGLHTGWMSAFLDVSEQRRVEELSRASQERLQATARLATVGEMASLLSHELNQPLAAISSYATGSLNLLGLAPGREQPPSPQDLADLRVGVQRIAAQAERAGPRDQERARLRAPPRPGPRAGQRTGLVRRRAAAGEPAGAQAVRARGAGHPGRPAPGAVRPHHGRAGAAEPGAQRHAGHGRPADPPAHPGLRVRRAASNAARGWLEFSVADMGSGIPQEVVERLFTPFYTTRAEGMGLGLSLCRTVVEQHGGFLGHATRQPRGTVFTFTLPVTP